MPFDKQSVSKSVFVALLSLLLLYVQVTQESTTSDAQGWTATVKDTVIVSQIIPFVGVPDTAMVTSGNRVTVDVLANDTGGEGPPVLITVSNPPTGQGDVIFTQAGVVYYTAPAGFTGVVS